MGHSLDLLLLFNAPAEAEKCKKRRARPAEHRGVRLLVSVLDVHVGQLVGTRGPANCNAVRKFCATACSCLCGHMCACVCGYLYDCVGWCRD